MRNKWPLAGVIAGIVLFLWGGFTHMVINVDNFMHSIPNEAAFTQALQTNLNVPGVYFYPNEIDPANLETRSRTEPRGLLTYIPAGQPFSFGRSLAVQFGLDLVCGLVGAFLFSMAAPALGGLGKRLLFTVLLGLFATFAVQAPYWNWYGFPAAAVVNNAFETGMGGLLMGLVYAKWIK